MKKMPHMKFAVLNNVIDNTVTSYTGRRNFYFKDQSATMPKTIVWFICTFVVGLVALIIAR